MSPDVMKRMQLQSNEFNALEDLIKAYKNLPPIVDDDYPEMRHYYNSSLRSFLEAVNHNSNWKVPGNYTSIMQPWAAKLGLRHQGVLVSAVRGCDAVQREDASKYLVRVFRGCLLRSHCGDLESAASFMIPYDGAKWDLYSGDFFSSIDHYPNHWLLHWAHACEIVGYKHDTDYYRVAFRQMYFKIVRKFHMFEEAESQLDKRLNADEKTFAETQKDR